MLKKIVLISVIVILVGAFLVPTLNDSTQLPEESNKLNVFVLAGQSNAAYYNQNITVANENAPIKDGFAHYYGTSSAPINCGVINDMSYDTTLESYGIYSMTDEDGTFKVGNIEAPFASYFVNNTNQKVLIINTGIGGVSIQSYTPGKVGFDYAANLIEDALTKLPEGLDPVLRGVLWVQGESDAALNVNTYIQKYSEMAAGFKSLGFNQTFISQTKSVNGGNASFAQTLIPDKVAGAHLVTEVANTFSVSNGLLAVDNLHYTQAADNIIGQAFAQCVISDYSIPVAYLSEFSGLIYVIPIIVIVAMILVAIPIIHHRND